MIYLTLPFPPSVNRYWRHVGQQTLISKKGREFRQRVCSALAHRDLKPIFGDLAVAIKLHPPDRRRRDADNYFKATLDALEHAGVYKDDSQILHLELDKGDLFPGGRTLVQIESHLDYLIRRSETVQLVCCARCGRDTYRQVDDLTDPYCDRCLSPNPARTFLEHVDRQPLY